MARPEKCYHICSKPTVREFAPLGIAPKGEVVMSCDEYEALRLIDVEGYTHLACAEKMGVSCAAVSQIYDNARQKLTRAMVEAKKLRIDGEDLSVCAASRPEAASFVNEVRVRQPKAGISAEEVARVKGLGCLWDKNTIDCFNVRVITRNGKITADESRAIAEAATLFGKGEIAMTSRMTVEIQGVPYDNIEPLREHLAAFGLETGGTGPKVRPVVSCKGTTCQYGLIDTFALSEEIHERFYKGYHDVKLPHKFKIAVGGCPNNCVRPNVNDLGIVGQKVPERDLDKCRGCKKCQIEAACPIRIAHVENGKLKVDPEVCNHCGRCVGKCPFKVVENYTSGYRIFIGGRGGKKGANGRPLEKIFTDREEVLQTVEKAIQLFRENGITGERFNDTVNRLGFENVQAQLLGTEEKTD